MSDLPGHWPGRADAPSRLSLLTVSCLNSSFLLPAARSFHPLQLICVKEKLYRKLVDKVEKYILVIKIKTTPKGGIALQVGSVHTLFKYVLSNSTSHIMPPPPFFHHIAMCKICTDITSCRKYSKLSWSQRAMKLFHIYSYFNIVSQLYHRRIHMVAQCNVHHMPGLQKSCSECLNLFSL